VSQLKAVLFDMGDTVVDLGEGRGSYEARVIFRVGRVYDALAASGVELGPRDAFCAALAENSEAQYQAALAEHIGISAPVVMRRFLQARGLPDDRETAEIAADAYCRGGPELVAPLRKGAVETLTTLRERGLLLAAVSNTIQPGRYLTANMQRWGLQGVFDARIYSSDVGHAKPHPRIFQAALQALGVAAENAVYVGDRLVPDVGGPHAIGMKAVLIEVDHRA
jgi:putative hydrolase of the HAD superfamily